VAEGEQAPNGLIVTDDMIDGAGEYVADITHTLARFGKTPADGAIESPIDIKRIHPQAFGTPDFRAWLPRGTAHPSRPTLLLYDFKFGHRVVEVFENPQLVEYAAGCISGTNLKDTDTHVIAKIVQPRAFHRDGIVRQWEFHGEDIRALVNVGMNAAHEALGPDPRTHTGPECRDCTARHACEAFQRAAQSAMVESGRPIPLDLDPAALGVEYAMARQALEVLEARVSGLEQQALALFQSGRNVPGLAVEHGRGRQRWTVPVDQILNIGRMMEINVAKPASALTPKQAIAAGLPEALVTGLTETPRAAAKIVKDDGSRARAIFRGRS
jgi:hypothetical protein